METLLPGVIAIAQKHAKNLFKALCIPLDINLKTLYTNPVGGVTILS
ncbi:Hypothetical protein DEACI_0965 [Acididesulfobacillus acetoxydans]|uniref:Uncharacterized protein n=1 Tax=Acididesulfobacillus acetoxydans TaxID=1561005 RepID=A0A8S0WEN8_9FIRM|nr:Hypothetical protein DEACI_0965 [Acididesulfobacillus acetoxydans]CEJ06088.1 Hypothetical protein DEACI_0534 [Acididesulfobacillus acetoxydans]